MSDIAERLRRGVQYWTPPGRYTDVPNVTVTDATMKEAADEIDRLREALEDSQSLLVAMLHEARPATEIEAQIVANRDALSSPVSGSAAKADWQLAAFDNTIALAEKCGMQRYGDLGLDHIKDMRTRIGATFSRAKVGRWLGWAQAAVVASNCGPSLDDMKVINRIASETARIADHEGRT